MPITKIIEEKLRQRYSGKSKIREFISHVEAAVQASSRRQMAASQSL